MSADAGQKWNALTFIGALALSVMTAVVFEPPPALTKKELFRSLETRANAYPRAPDNRRIALGVNTCVDLVVPALELLTSDALSGFAVPADSKDHALPNSLQDVGETFAHFFALGSAAERFVHDEALFEQLVAAASALPSAEYRVGGNAALMASRLAADGAEVGGGGRVGSKLKSLLPASVTLAKQEQDARLPESTEEVHLILEYPSEASFGSFSSKRANRLILSPSTDLAEDAIEAFGAALPAFAPQLLVLSGLQLLEGKPAAHRLQRIDAMRGAGAAAPDGTKVHIELASLAEPALTKDIAAKLFGSTDSIGLNEEELASLFTALGGDGAALPNTEKLNTGNSAGEVSGLKSILSWRFVTIVRNFLQGLKAKAGIGSAPVADADAASEEVDLLNVLRGKAPDVAAVSAAIAHVLAASEERLSRVHFHALGYHIVALRAGAEEKWGGHSRTVASVARGSIRATMQACNATVESDLHGDDLKLELGISSVKVAAGETTGLKVTVEQPVLSWQHGGQPNGPRFVLAPVLVCEKPKVTVGLGDAISAAAIGAYFV